MAIDTPAKLAILGAGPIGLEAALYARFLGYDVVIYERGDVAQSVRQWGYEHMDTPFVQNRTTLGIAAIQAQDESYRTPADDELLTGQQWLERYLLPLSQTDLLADHLRLNTTVIVVEKEQQELDEWSFRLLSSDALGQEQTDTFHAVLDCTGDSENANLLEPGVISQPNFHILGEKNHAPPSPFRLTDGHDQIRRLFAILGDRATLDLYSSATRLIR